MSKADKLKARAAARLHRSWSRRPRRDRADARGDPRDLRALRLRARRDAVRRIHRRARQIPARPGPAERGRVLVPGRRRAVAVAALRPDGAARPLCGGELRRAAKPYRSYRAGWVFRNEKPGPGRFRQFMQFDADTVGAASVAADAEICMMAADTLEALGIERGDYVIKVNNRKVLDGVLEAIGLGGEDKAGQRLTVLRAIDKLDRLGADGVRQLLGPGRKDESGDFTKGASLGAEAPSSVFWPSRLRQGRNGSGDASRTCAGRGGSERGRRRRRRTGRDRRAGGRARATGTGSIDRSLRRARPRILHRPGLRGRADLQGHQRGRPAGALRLGRRRRAL